MLPLYSTILPALLTLVLSGVHGAQINVTVGGIGVLKYDPEFVTANPGDSVIFNFRQANHTATQSTFDAPCQMADGGFDSGFIPVLDSNTDGPFPSAQYVVQDTNPVWVYCRQANHCQQGMVFAINPGSKFAAFQASAMGLNTTSTSSSGSTISTSSLSSTSTSTSTAPVATTPSIVTVTATVTASGSAEVTTYGSFPGSAAPTAVASSDHVITVGGAGTLTFSPSNITAQAGDTITFQFVAKNHTATQSSFADPCTPLTQTSTSGQVGFDSGFMPVPSGATSAPAFTIQVNDTAPIWVFCRQTNPSSHCAAGMVFSANAVESSANNFAAFQAKAMQTNSSSTGSGSSASKNAAMRFGRGAGIASVLAAAVAAVLF